MPKVAVVGAGQVGSTTAMRLAERGVSDVALIDVQGELALGKALDIGQSLALASSGVEITGGGEYRLAEGCEVAVITAGYPRKPGMSRQDLLRENAAVVKEVVASLAEVAPDCVLLMVTNPLDEMSYLAWRITGWDRRRIMGMAGMLDGARYAYFIAREMGISPNQVRATVLGSHGDAMLPLARFTTVGGEPVAEKLGAEKLEELAEKTRAGGAEIVSLLKSGSAYFAPSACVAAMVEAILEDRDLQVTASVLLRGEYGLEEVFLGVPVELGAGGWKKVVELPLIPPEMEALRACAGMIREKLVEIDEWLEGSG
jgi:malate dehydrogenase